MFPGMLAMRKGTTQPHEYMGNILGSVGYEQIEGHAFEGRFRR